MDTELKPLPTSLAGFQAVVYGCVQEGDLLVEQAEPGLQRDVLWARLMDIGIPITTIEGSNYTTYRKIPVANHRDTASDETKALIAATEGQFPTVTVTVPGADPLTKTKALEVMASTLKALTYDDGKPPLANVPPEGLRAVARVQAYGHKKYGDFNNYRKGMEASRQMNCIVRHIMAYMDGEDNDKESGESHLAHAATRLMFALQNIKDGTMIDDRFKRAS
jgi:hypothetical protein